MDAPSPDLETGELRSFVVLAEQRHFGRAAELLNVSQPALSKRLQKLEEKVGGPLFLRGYREVRLTEPGRVLLERAKALLRGADQALEASRSATKGEAGRIRVGFGVASIADLLPEVLRRFRKTHPKVQVEMRDMSSSAQRLALQRDEIDLGFVRMPISDPELESVPILHERLVAALGPGMVWRDKAGLASLADQPAIVACSRSISASYYDHVVALCRKAGFAPRIVTETNELFSLLQLVRAGIGAALVPSAAAVMRVPGVRFKEVGLAEAAWDIALVWKKGLEPNLIVEAFAKVARGVYAQRSR